MNDEIRMTNGELARMPKREITSDMAAYFDIRDPSFPK
jgi:hypothetical protein